MPAIFTQGYWDVQLEEGETKFYVEAALPGFGLCRCCSFVVTIVFPGFLGSFGR